jgi:hypothetical protein
MRRDRFNSAAVIDNRFVEKIRPIFSLARNSITDPPYFTGLRPAARQSQIRPSFRLTIIRGSWGGIRKIVRQVRVKDERSIDRVVCRSFCDTRWRHEKKECTKTDSSPSLIRPSPYRQIFGSSVADFYVLTLPMP